MRNMLSRLYRFFVRTERKLKTTQIIILTFAAIILIGAILLQLPVASRTGERVSFLDALFTATSATCVTGLSVGDTYTMWSGFGQCVILCLIQLGGLGFMTIVTIFFFLLNRRIGLRQRLVIAQALSLNELEGVVKTVRHVIVGTVLFEAVGALLLTLRFSFQVPFGTALKWGIFHAVSAFCNAGFDLFGQLDPSSSMACFAGDWVVNLVIMLLITIGGLGFFVWEDLLKNRGFRGLSIYSRLVLLIHLILVLSGWLLFLLLEWNNAGTIGAMSVPEKLLASLFQSVTTRTAGFASFDQGAMTDASKAVTMVLMMIGGASGSTAGGVKTVTIGVLLIAAVSVARGKRYVRVFDRTIRQEQISQAMAITILVLLLDLIGSVIICVAEGIPLLDAGFEAVSAMGTVGLSTGITAGLHRISKILLTIYMFFGRVGVITISLGFLYRKPSEERYRYADTNLLIG